MSQLNFNRTEIHNDGDRGFGPNREADSDHKPDAANNEDQNG